jgi:hypothetical protein
MHPHPEVASKPAHNFVEKKKRLCFYKSSMNMPPTHLGDTQNINQIIFHNSGL